MTKYYYLLLLFVTAAVVIFLILEKRSKRQLLLKIKREWQDDAIVNNQKNEADLKKASVKIGNFTNKPTNIDNRTWEDLDLFKVFQKINHTYSTVGEEFLYYQLRTLKAKETDFDQLEARIQYFEKNPEIREQMQYHFASLGKINTNHSYLYFEPEKTKSLAEKFDFTLLGLLPIASLFLIFFSKELGIGLLIGSMMLNTILYLVYKAKLEVELTSMSYLIRSLSLAKKLTTFECPDQNNLKTALTDLQKVLKWGVFFRTKNGSEAEMILEMFISIFLLPFVSFKVVIKLLQKQQQNLWLIWKTLGEIETAISVLNYRENHTAKWCTPQFISNEILKGEGIAHPLIENPVSNPVLAVKPILITGSNASGKSTYIKAVAINCILAQTLHMALAETFELKAGRVVTSMGIVDNLDDGDSYFMVEIKSLKRLLTESKENEFTYCFIDEILRGTNTIERISASSSMIQWLSKQRCLCFIATHDIELATILGETCENIYFSEEVDEAQGFYFDYQLKHGINTKRNALKLLKHLEFPNDLVVNAEQELAYFESQQAWRVLSNEE